MRIDRRLAFFILIIAIQIAMVVAMPLRAMRIRAEGKEISLDLAPVDPYDLLTGYSLDLDYRAANKDNYPATFQPAYGQTVFAILRKRGLVYEPLALLRVMPHEVAADQIAMRGVYERRGGRARIWFGTEKLYIPEEQRLEVGDVIRSLEQKARTSQSGAIPGASARADIKVDRSGNSSLLRLHVGESTYE